jgi:ABC-type branched-subunit amino acid transport system ATPase component
MQTLNLISGATTGLGPEDMLTVTDLSVAYGRRVVLRKVSAEIGRGQVVGVVGPNG